MKYRRWIYTDIVKIAEFQKKHFPDAWTYQQLADSFLNGRFYGYLVEEEGEIIACSAINFSLEDADLVNVLVAHSYRNMGIATNLIKEMFDDCKKMELKSLFLEVRASNYPAINLYEKNGFKEISKRLNYYKDGETAIIMKKEFDYR